MRSGACATTARSDGRATRSTSAPRCSASQWASSKMPPTAGQSVMDRSSLASSHMAATDCANPNKQPVDLWTTLRVAHRVHSPNSNSSTAEQNEKCVTHVAGQNCYLCRRLLRVRGRGRQAQNCGAQNRGEAPSPSPRSSRGSTSPRAAGRGEKSNPVLATHMRPRFA